MPFECHQCALTVIEDIRVVKIEDTGCNKVSEKKIEDVIPEKHRHCEDY